MPELFGCRKMFGRVVVPGNGVKFGSRARPPIGSISKNPPNKESSIEKTFVVGTNIPRKRGELFYVTSVHGGEQVLVRAMEDAKANGLVRVKVVA